MGRVLARTVALLLLMGPWLLPEELGRPTCALNRPSATESPARNSSVPSSLQPVKG